MNEVLSPEELQRLLELAKREIQALKKAALTNTATTAISAVAGSYSCTHCGVMNSNTAGISSNLPASRVSFSRLQLVDSAVTTPRSTCTGASADSNSELPNTTVLSAEAVEDALVEVTDNTIEVTTPTVLAIKDPDPAVTNQKKGVEKREEGDTTRQELMELRVRVQELEGELVAVKMK